MLEIAATLVVVPILLVSLVVFVSYNLPRCEFFQVPVTPEQEQDNTDLDLDLETRLEMYKKITDIYESTLLRLPSMIELNYYLKQVLDDSDFKISDIKDILQESLEYKKPNVKTQSKRYSPMDPSYYNDPINTNLMDVFFEASKCVKKVDSKQSELPMISGIAFDESYEYKQPLAKYSSDRNMNELMGNIARNTYYLNNTADHTEQIVSQPLIYPSNMSADILYDIENILGDNNAAGAPYILF